MLASTYGPRVCFDVDVRQSGRQSDVGHRRFPDQAGSSALIFCTGLCQRLAAWL